MRIHIVMNGQTVDYYEHCVKNHTLLADDPTNLDFVAYSLDGWGYAAVEKLGGKVVRLRDGAGSTGHMIGLDAAFDNFVKNDINVISDSDCVVLMKGWDTKLREIMLTSDVVGSTYEDLGGFSSGNSTTQTYKRVPNFSWCALSSNYDWKFDTSLSKEKPLLIETQTQSETFNLPIGYSLFREPCWQFPVYLHERKIPYYSLEFVRPTSSKAKAVLTGEDYHTEYTLSDGTPYVAHQRGSMKHKFRVDHLSKTFYDACDKYIAEELKK